MVEGALKAKRRPDWYAIAARLGCTSGAAQAQWWMLQWSPLIEADLRANRLGRTPTMGGSPRSLGKTD